MTDTHRLAQLIASCWRISGESVRIPTSNGMLDRALQTTCNTGAFPDWARERLHFVDSRIGLKCVEIPDILEWAQRSQLTSVPNPTYDTTEVQISDRVAKYLLLKLEIKPEDGIRWGQTLRDAISEVEKNQGNLDQSRVEEY